MGMLTMLNAVVTHSEQCVTYRVEQAGFQAIAFAPADRPREVHVGRMVQEAGDGMCKFVEVKRMEPPSQPTTQQVESLLPIANPNTRIAVRRDATGQVCAELIALQEDWQDVQAMWENHGWSVREQLDQPTIPANSESPTEIAPAQNVFICQRGKVSLMAVISGDAAHSPRTMLVVHAP